MIKALLLTATLFFAANFAAPRHAGAQERIHVVQSGETLMSLSRRYDVSVDAIRNLNNIQGDVIRIGQRIRIPTDNPGSSELHSDGAYITGEGETLYSIAHLFGVPADSLLARNDVANRALEPGTALMLPGRSGTVEHRVRAGETLMSLSRRYDVPVAAIRRENNLRSDQINIGQTLRITAGRGGPASVQTEKGSVVVYPEIFDGRLTASGESYDPNRFTVSHRTLPLQTVVLLTNVATGRKTFAVVNDRGPLEAGFFLDVSAAVADVLDLEGDPDAEIRLEVIR